MLKKYLICALVSMVPLIELRGGVPIAVGMGLPYIKALIVCVIANMLPVPVIYFFARKVLEWGKDKKYIGKFFTYCIEKGERGGRKLTEVPHSKQSVHLKFMKLLPAFPPSPEITAAL